MINMIEQRPIINIFSLTMTISDWRVTLHRFSDMLHQHLWHRHMGEVLTRQYAHIDPGPKTLNNILYTSSTSASQLLAN